MSLPFTPLGDRVVIQADIEDHAPAATESGLLTAKTLAAAVSGEDVEESWFVGTIVGLGPLVNHFDCRAFISRRLGQLAGSGLGSRALTRELTRLVEAIAHLPTDCPDPLRVGDRVTFSWSAGQQMTVDGVKYLVLNASDILAVLSADEVA